MSKSFCYYISMVKTPRENGVTGTQWEPDLWRRAFLRPPTPEGAIFLGGGSPCQKHSLKQERSQEEVTWRLSYSLVLLFEWIQLDAIQEGK